MITLVYHFVLLFGWESRTVCDFTASNNMPFVSIAISVRNEEENIPNLIQSIRELDYPTDSFEVLIGDDHSSDKTMALLKKDQTANLRVFAYHDKDLRGKRQVLADLLKKAKGDYYLLTDADMVFNHNWIRSMLYDKKKYSQVMSGATIVKGQKLFHRLQNMDWLAGQAVLNWFFCKGKSLAVWGNNLIVDAQSYHQCGGYDAVPETIVEDIGLMTRIKSTGGVPAIKFDKNTLAFTQPQRSIASLFHQRKRWMKGVSKLPGSITALHFVKFSFVPVCFVGCFLDPIFIFLMIVYIGLYALLFRKISLRLKFPLNFWLVVPFVIYEFVIYFLTFVFYLLPIETKWKGRKYSYETN